MLGFGCSPLTSHMVGNICEGITWKEKNKLSVKKTAYMRARWPQSPADWPFKPLGRLDSGSGLEPARCRGGGWAGPGRAAPVPTCLYQSALSLSPSQREAAGTWSGKLTGVKRVSTRHYLGSGGAPGVGLNLQWRLPVSGHHRQRAARAAGKLRRATLALSPKSTLQRRITDSFSYIILHVI